jgi:hypothetical protein
VDAGAHPIAGWLATPRVAGLWTIAEADLGAADEAGSRVWKYGNDGGKNPDHARDGTAVAQKSPAFLGLPEF